MRLGEKRCRPKERVMSDLAVGVACRSALEMISAAGPNVAKAIVGVAIANADPRSSSNS